MVKIRWRKLCFDLDSGQYHKMDHIRTDKNQVASNNNVNLDNTRRFKYTSNTITINLFGMIKYLCSVFRNKKLQCVQKQAIAPKSSV